MGKKQRWESHNTGHLHPEQRFTNTMDLCMLVHFDLLALLVKHSLNTKVLFFLFVYCTRSSFVTEGACMWKSGASWKSSATVSLLLAVHVCMSVKEWGGGGYSENVRRRVCTWVTQWKTNQKKKRAKEGAQRRWRAWNVSGIAISPHCAWGRLPGCPPIKLNGMGLMERIQGKLLNNADKLETRNQTYWGGEPSSWGVIVWRGYSDVQVLLFPHGAKQTDA